MPDTRSHRGPHPDDAADFAPAMEQRLALACGELSYLSSRGYAEHASLKLVGDRHQLRARQRSAILRAACSDEARARRSLRRVELCEARTRPLAIDGFNCLITIECMLGRAPVFEGRDGALRDLASVHGTYRQVQETERAVELMLDLFARHAIADAQLWLDRPVGNSGRLAQVIEAAALRRALPLRVVLSEGVDRGLYELGCVVASSDSWLLDRAPAWLDVPRAVAEHAGLAPWLLRLGTP